MKKILNYLLLLLILLTGCVTNQTDIVNQFGLTCEDDVCVMAEYNIYNQGVLQVEVEWTNNNVSKIGPSDNYHFEKKTALSWSPVNGYTEEEDESGVELFLDKGETDVLKYPVLHFSDGLDEGEYRIITTYWPNYTPVQIYFSVNSEGRINPSITHQQEYWTNAESSFPETDMIDFNVENYIYDEGVTEVYAYLRNNTEYTFTYGEYYSLEMLLEDEWKVVEKELNTGPDIAFVSIGYSLSPNEEVGKRYDMWMYTDGLTPGTYRISTQVIKDSIDDNDHSDYTERSYQLYAEFRVE